MSLEDEVSDVFSKAIKGLERKSEDVAEAAGLTVADLNRILNGEFDETNVRKLAPILGLDPTAITNLPSYLPIPREIEGIRRIELPFRQWTVNAWLLEKHGTTLLFDTGWNRNDILNHVDISKLNAVFITHGHEDHMGGVDDLKSYGVRVFSESEGLETVDFQFGEIGIKSIDLSGHCEPSTGYFVSGFEKQLLIVGDAIFAGSIGACASKRKFELAFQNLRGAFEDADEDCLILTGHGPMTSISEEKISNPFRS